MTPVQQPKPEPPALERHRADPVADPRRIALRRELLRRIIERESRRHGIPR